MKVVGGKRGRVVWGAGIVIRRSPVQDLPLPLAGFVSWLSRVQILNHALYIANWSASCQLGFLTLLCSFKIICLLSFSGMPVN